MPQFVRYIGIDYSGTETPDSSCKGLRVYAAEGSGTVNTITIPTSPALYHGAYRSTRRRFSLTCSAIFVASFRRSVVILTVSGMVRVSCTP